MLNAKIKNIFLLLVLLLAIEAIKATYTSAFTPPTQITLQMFRLDPATGAKYQPEEWCSNGNIHWGCTAVPNDPQYAYPFSSNPVTVDIDGNDPGDPQHGIDYNRYLRDVTPVEVAIAVASRNNKPLSTVKAQAIATRTYTYFHHGQIINNSNQYQVFVPYSFDRLTLPQQQRVNEAVHDVWYMSLSNSTDAIAALYGADNGAITSQGALPYLKSVPDPISADYGSANGTLNGGMSSRGASRWGFGHTSSLGPDYETSSYYPHDVNGNGDLWSVRYDWAKQILMHYYTAIHIRDASGKRKTPSIRWVPLKIEWLGNDCPPVMSAGSTCTARVWVQNTGTTTWQPGQIQLWRHSWNASLQGQTQQQSNGITAPVHPGETIYQDVPFTVPFSSSPGRAYWLRLDMETSDYEWISTLEPGRPWPTYDVPICVGGNCRTFMPFVLQ